MYYWMYFLTENGYVDVVAEKSTFGHLTQEKLQVVPITVIPPDEEQRIVEMLDTELARIRNISDKIEQIIALLNERRAGLIAAAVSGQIRVG